MNFNNKKFLIKLEIIFIITGPILIGCSTSQYSVAPINNLHDSSYILDDCASINISSKNTSMPSSLKKAIIGNQNNSINKQIHHVAMSDVNSKKKDKIIYNRNYNNINKGRFISNTYTVKQDDTLFYIAWITGNNYRDLAKRNKITEFYNLSVGKVLNISNNFKNSEIIGKNKTINKKNINNSNMYSDSPNTNDLSGIEQNSGKMLSKIYKSLHFPDPTTITSFNLNNKNPVNIVWPTKGKVIESFSNVQGGNKGVDIAGSRGQPIFATALGKVVYSGNGLRGYGNLIIIKHNDDYLSAYAHNDRILVHDKQEVKAGQKIATMGSTGTSSVKLHFEIRYKGKSVNPLRYFLHK
ncbi:MAG: murein hydrolase activator NlpD [Arsenophonus sp.]